MRADQLTWGAKWLDIEAPALWGARCILSYGPRDKRGKRDVLLDILWNRQDLQGDDVDAHDRLAAALNGGGIAAYRKALEGGHLPSTFGPDVVVRHTYHGLEFAHVVRGEYLYVVARLEGEGHGPNHLP